MKLTHEEHNAFLAHEPLPGVSLKHNDCVKVIGGDHTGDTGSIVSVEELGDDPVYLVELESKQDVLLQQTQLQFAGHSEARHAQRMDPPESNQTDTATIVRNIFVGVLLLAVGSALAIASSFFVPCKVFTLSGDGAAMCAFSTWFVVPVTLIAVIFGVLLVQPRRWRLWLVLGTPILAGAGGVLFVGAAKLISRAPWT